MTLFTAAQLDDLQGFERIAQASAQASFASVSTDSRTMDEGALFVPLIGPRFDGHRFLGEAVEKGAGGMLVSHLPEELPALPVWKVDDTLFALGELAREHRSRFELPVLGLTGTSGKTTTKELLRSILSKRSLLVNEGNFNNLIGVPLTLFRLGEEHQVAVIEMGMNRFGEIGRLTQIAQPTVGLINNIGPGHLEGVGDLEGVLRAKTELPREMPAGRTIVLNADDSRLRRFGTGAQRPVVWFGLQRGADVTATDIRDLDVEGSEFTLRVHGASRSVRLRLPGEHNLRNALAAAAGAHELGATVDDIAKGIENAHAFSMRMEVVAGPKDTRLILDCYNANPASMREALRLLASARRRGRVAAVLGDMLELGEKSEELHRELGKDLAALEPDRAWVVGDWSEAVVEAAANDRIVATKIDDLARDVRDWLEPGDTVLIKGSRGAKLERVADALQGGKGDD